MLVRNINFEVLSKQPLYIIGENNKPMVVQNKYDYIEVIRCYQDDNCLLYFDIPIEKITIFFEQGLIFFKSKEDCIKLSKNINTNLGKQTLIENALEVSKKNKSITKFSLDAEHPVDYGLYVIKDIDDCCSKIISSSEVCYIDENNEVKDFKIAGKNEDYYLKKYISMLNIEHRHNLKLERIIFEIYSENDKVYINHFYISDFGYRYSEPILFFSRIMGYPICTNKRLAKKFLKYQAKEGINYGSIVEDAQEVTQYVKIKENIEQRKIQLKNKIVSLCFKFVWDQVGKLVNAGIAKVIS